MADILADRLLGAGKREEARSVAVALSGGPSPVHRVESELLLLRVEASEARFGAALRRARRAIEIRPDDSGWVLVQRLEIAWRALQVAEILGSPAEIADLVVTGYLDPEPPPLSGAYLSVPIRLAAVCALASEPVSRRCFSRFRALRGPLSGGILKETDAFTDGAEHHARGDFRAAAKAWRPLLREPGVFASVLPAAMVETFERTGEHDLVERLLAAAPADAAELHGASLLLVSAARRAERKGDRETARMLARRIIDAWSVADETVPAVEEMKTLLGRSR